MSIRDVQSVRMGLIGGINKVQAGYQNKDAADFLNDYGTFGFFVAVCILLDGTVVKHQTSPL